MRSSWYFLLPLVLVLAAPLRAQTSPGLGSTVRISSPELYSGHTSGALQRVTADTLVVSGKAVSRSSIGRIDVSTGRKSHLLLGMGIGLVSGAASAALVCGLACHIHGGDGVTKGAVLAFVTVTGGLSGLGIGALFGSEKTEQWQRSSLGTLTVSPTVGAKGGLGLSLRLRF